MESVFAHAADHCSRAVVTLWAPGRKTALGLLLLMAASAAVALEIERHQGAEVAADFSQVRSAPGSFFAPAERDAGRAVLLRDGVRGSWFRLSGVTDPATIDPPLLVLGGGQSIQWTLYLPPHYRPQALSMRFPADPPEYSQRALGTRITAPLTADSPGYLHVSHAGARPIQIEVESASTYRQRDLQHTKFIYAAVAANVVLLLVNLALWINLRDRVYGYFVAYMGGVTLYIALSSGEGFGWPLVGLFRHWAPHGPWFVAILTTVAGVGFIRHFLELDRLAPRLARIFTVYAIAMSGLAALLVLPWQQPLGWFPMVANAALAIIAPLTLAAALVALTRGSRHALVYLLGWFPLVLFTTYRTLQLLGAVPANPIGEYGYYASSTVAAVVFSLGLADRALDLARERDHARAEAESDVLTGALSRRAIERHLAQAFADARSLGTELVVMVIDLDHFKRINDQLGHLVGDDCLAQLVRSVRRELRPGDAVGRWGGEEFIVVAQGLDLRTSLGLAESIRARIAHECRIGEGAETVDVTATIGIAALGPHHANPLALVTEADTALYAGKRGGRNRVAVGGLATASVPSSST